MLKIASQFQAAAPTPGQVLIDPSTSHWLRAALQAGLTRDPVDAANDALLLARVLESRADQVIAASERYLDLLPTPPRPGGEVNPQTYPDIGALLARYLRVFPSEKTRMAPLALQLDEPDVIFARSNMRGHLTSSCLVLNKEATKALLVHHLVLQAWLSPGGHYQFPQTMWESARRETIEETGVADVELHSWCVENGIPVDIDTHQIPANPLKRESDHVHYDLMYLAWADENSPLVAQLQEVHAVRWFPLKAAADEDDRVRYVLRKCRTHGLIV